MNGASCSHGGQSGSCLPSFGLLCRSCRVRIRPLVAAPRVFAYPFVAAPRAPARPVTAPRARCCVCSLQRCVDFVLGLTFLPGHQRPDLDGYSSLGFTSGFNAGGTLGQRWCNTRARRFHVRACPTVGFSDPILLYFSTLRYNFDGVCMLKARN